MKAPQLWRERDRIASLAAVIMAAFGVGMAFGVGFPLTALTLEAWHTPNWLIGIAGAAPSVAVLLALPFLPRLVARWGVVRAIATGCLVGAAGFLALSEFHTAQSWIVIRFLMSLGLALPWLAGETWINMVTREETRGRVIAIYAISFFSGYSVGPLLLDYIGLAGRAPFVAGAAAMALAGLPIMLAAKLAPDVSETGQSQSVLRALRLAPVGMAGGFIGGFAEMSYLSLLANVGLAGGLDQGGALRLMSFMTLGGVVLQFAIGWLADKVPRTQVTAALAVAFIVLSLALPVALSSPAIAYAVVFVLGGVILGFYTLGLAIVGEEVSARDLAAANAAFLVMYQIGAIAGPAAAGVAMTSSPVLGFVITVSLAMALAAPALVWLARKT
ncbi:MAG: MFS transporter [Hyphomicrobium sp.]